MPPGQGATDIDFGVALHKTGTVSVLEAGLVRPLNGHPYATGDVFAVLAAHGTVVYYQNGQPRSKSVHGVDGRARLIEITEFHDNGQRAAVGRYLASDRFTLGRKPQSGWVPVLVG